jgi:hypothetical protein
MFSLVVDNFGVKYGTKHHVTYLIDTIEEHYKFSTDWEGRLYCGIHIKWDYENRTVDLSMLGYIAATLHKYQHPLTPKGSTCPVLLESAQLWPQTTTHGPS